MYLDGASAVTGSMTGNKTLAGLSVGYDAQQGVAVGGTWTSVAVINNSVTADEAIGYCRRAASKWGTPQ